MIFKIDFTRPHLYEDAVTLNQGNLSTNNTLRCRVVTGGSDDVTGANIVCTFVINGKQVFESGKVIDGPRGIVDVIFPSEALVVGENTLEFLVNRIDGSVAQSPVIKYRVWQGLTTDEGVRADSNYPLLIELINQANSAVNSANEALEGANSVISQGDELKASVDKLKADCIASVNSFTEENSAKIDNVITQNVAKIDAAIVKNEASIVKADAAAEKAILAANNSDTKTAENIKNVNAAIAAGTQDLEVKAARVDMVGVEHGSLKERLNSDFSIGDRSLKDYVIDLDNMKESQDFAYETDKGYLVCKDTQNGVVKDLNIYGKNLVNKSKIKTTSFEGRIINLFSDSILNGFTIITDTIKNTASKGIAISITDINGVATYPLIQKPNTTGKSVWFFDKQVKEISIYLQLDDYGADKATVDNIMILEGDHRSNLPNGYFEGIASVGNGNEIEVLSCNSNIVDVEDFLKLSNGYTVDNGVYTVRANTNMFSQGYKINPFEQVTFSCKAKIVDSMTNFRLRLVYTDGTFNESNMTSLTNDFTLLSVTSKKDKIVDKIACNWSATGTLQIKNFQLTLTDSYVGDIERKQDKKPILFKDTDGAWKPVTELRGIDLNSCDTIEEHSDGKQYLHVRTEKRTLNGLPTEIWEGRTPLINTIRFSINLPNAKKEILANSIYTLSDTIPSKSFLSFYNIDNVEGLAFANDSTFLNIQILKSKLETQDVAGFKKWLQANPLTVIYQLAEEKVYEVNPLDLESFENETMIAFGSGAIAPHASWKITSSLPNFVQNIEDRVCRLENDAYKVNLANFTVALNMLDMKARLESLEAPIN